jgi:endonuclease/exonuclease/phosphatase family metal-dependent hydrolase
MRRIRIATFNIRHGLGTDERIDLERVAEAMVACDAGLVALQEVDRGMARSGRIDQAAVLARLTGMDVSFHPTLKRAGGLFGLALAARGPVEQRFQRLPRVAGERRRGVIIARWKGVTVVATHLSAPAGPRPAQLEALAAVAAEQPSPVAVAGDLNEGRAGLLALTRLGFVPTPYRVTIPARARHRHIDHVLAGPGLVHVSSATVRSSASDHRPLVAELGVAEDVSVK